MMIGKTVFEQYTPREGECQEAILQVKHLSNHRLNTLSFDVHAGEIAGFYGLVGAGKTELARAIYGVDEYEGEIVFKGKKLQPAPDKAIAAGIALVPEESQVVLDLEQIALCWGRRRSEAHDLSELLGLMEDCVHVHPLGGVDEFHVPGELRGDSQEELVLIDQVTQGFLEPAVGDHRPVHAEQLLLAES